MLLDLAVAACVASFGVAVITTATFGGLVWTRTLLPPPAEDGEAAPESEATARAEGWEAALLSLVLFVFKAYVVFHLLCRLYLQAGLIAALVIVPVTAYARRDGAARRMLKVRRHHGPGLLRGVPSPTCTYAKVTHGGRHIKHGCT